MANTWCSSSSRTLRFGAALGFRLVVSNRIYSTTTSRKTFLRNFGFPVSPFSLSKSASSVGARVSTSTMATAANDVVRFPLSPSNALVIQKGDITKWSVDASSDAIVCTISSIVHICLFFYEEHKLVLPKKINKYKYFHMFSYLVLHS